MSLFDTELYPTPDSVIQQMLEPYLMETGGRKDFQLRSFIKAGKICDPGGGTGAILDFLCGNIHVPKHQLATFEINNELRYLLQGKGYKVYGQDWLEYDSPSRFSLIVMNPPFSQAAKHILHGWRHLAPGGHLVALLNQVNLDSPADKFQQTLAGLIEQHGGCGKNSPESQAMTNLGKVFTHAERGTNVDVGMIRLHRPESDPSPFDFADTGEFEFNPIGALNEDYDPSALEVANEVKNLVGRYNAVHRLVIERHESQVKLNFFMKGIPDPLFDEEAKNRERNELSPAGHLTLAVPYEDLELALRQRFWNAVFTRTKLGSQTTNQFKRDFVTFLQAQSAMAFTEQNVNEVLYMFLATGQEQMTRALVACFDKATAYHSDNKIHDEGWVTNLGWKVNKKIIIPNGISTTVFYSIGNDFREFLDDLDMVLCWISGVKFRTITLASRVIGDLCYASSGSNWTNRTAADNMEVKIHKKGTVHIWINPDLLDEFNYRAAEAKGWSLGDGSKHKRHASRYAPKPASDPAPGQVQRELPVLTAAGE